MRTLKFLALALAALIALSVVAYATDNNRLTVQQVLNRAYDEDNTQLEVKTQGGTMARTAGSQYLASSPMTLTSAISEAWELREVRIRCTAATTQTAWVTIDSASGTWYDTRVGTITMTSAANALWQPTFPILLRDGDEVVLTVGNLSTPSQTVYAEIIGEILDY